VLVLSRGIVSLLDVFVGGRVIMDISDWNVKPAVFCGLVLLTAFACSVEEKMSFANDVKPVLDRYCFECHVPGGSGFEVSGLDLSDYNGLMAGTRSGPMVIPGDSLGSNLLVLMEGRADPSIKMPHGSSEKVSAVELNAIRLWIDQGAENN
jgi:hypothetical protein